MVDRREALRRLGALAAGAVSLGSGGEAVGDAMARPATSPISRGRIDPIGVQLYTVRSEMKEGVERTLERVAEIGYQEVEFAGYFGRSPTQIREILARTGLRSPATHIAPSFEPESWARILDQANEVGHDYVVVAWTPETMRTDLDAWRRTAETMTRAGEQARAAGLQYAYHNHDFEFAKMEGRVAFDVFCEESDPDLVQIELDLFWIIHGGGDPIDFFQRWPGRVPLVHVKDRTASGDMVDVGSGVIDWSGIFQHIEAAGTEHFFVEHDRPGDAFGSIRNSYGFMSTLVI
jgi:sugar phosphate isomerase/epimerase